MQEVVTDAAAGAVYWNRRYGGAERGVDAALKSSLRDSGLTVESFAASLLFEPWTVQTGSGTPYSVFTPFWRACGSMPPPRAPLPEPRDISGPRSAPASDDLDDWGLLPTRPDWAERPSRAVGAGRAGSACPPAQLPLRRHRRLRPHARRAGRRRDLRAVAPAALGRAQPVHGVARDHLVRPPGRSVPLRDRVARVRGARAVPPPRPGDEESAARIRRVPLAAPAAVPPARVAAGAHRHTARGCRDARALEHRSDAQPGADGHGILPHQEPAHRLATGRAVVLGHARRRGRRLQPLQLAVGRRLRR